MYINKLDDCYLILNANPSWSFKRIRSSYQKEILKYHKFRKHSISYRNKFIAMVLAFDCLEYIGKKRGQRYYIKKNELFAKWKENEFPLAFDMANKFLQLKTQDFERIFYKGFVAVKWIVYVIFLIIIAFLIIIPVLELQEDRSLIIAVALISVFTIPLFKKMLDVLKAESNSSKKIRYINHLKGGIKYKGKDDSDFDEDQIITPQDHLKINQKNN